ETAETVEDAPTAESGDASTQEEAPADAPIETKPTATTAPSITGEPTTTTPTTTTPVEPAEPPATTTTDPPTTTTDPPVSATVFTGPAESNVQTLAFTGGVVCRAPEDTDYNGTVELTCDDETVIHAVGRALTPEAVEASTVDGVWRPVLTVDGSPQTVAEAVRG
ncbi:MAG: hypothetical protein WBQ44_08895, partial [Rhodococcus sp. (in: high G+C Gram-positive bacteria)]